MKKAVYYARVSTSLQEERGTIDSQKTEIIKQIKADGNILVKEYIDNGWSGARLDRPALDEFRNDLKTDLFETVYFWDSDRIARDSTYQNIIVAEILKYGKQIVIKGKDYINNPENKFTLTVLGAVNELEKAKIIERSQRGKRERARRNEIMGGSSMYGYDYVFKTKEKSGYFNINEEQASVVRDMFDQYANTGLSISGLVFYLERKKYKTANGKYKWARSSVKHILNNASYYGQQYYNRTESLESNNPDKKYAKHTKTRRRGRDQKEWISVKIPEIISKELFDKVQAKLARNYKLTRNSGRSYLLSTLIKCGECDHTYTGYTNAAWGNHYYRCNYRTKGNDHLKELEFDRCSNKQISGKLIEKTVWDVVLEKVLQPNIVKGYIEVLKSGKEQKKKELENKIEKMGVMISSIEEKKKRVLDLYSDGTLDKDGYLFKINELEAQLVAIKKEREEIISNISKLGSRKEIQKGINWFCKLARKRANTLNLEEKKLFLQQLIKEIIYCGDKAIIRGYIPITASNTQCWPVNTCGWFGRGPPALSS